MAALIGKVGMVMKGAWSSSATYEVLDAVSYNNGLYIAKQAVPANTVPTNTTYWQSAIDATTLLDGMSFTHNTLTRSGNILSFYTGNSTSFKLIGNFTGYTGIIMAHGHVNVASFGTYRGIYWIDRDGNKKELSNVGGTAPTISVNADHTEMTITLSVANQFIYIISNVPYSVELT